jgi:hypothetical protein
MEITKEKYAKKRYKINNKATDDEESAYKQSRKIRLHDGQL